MMRTLGEPVIVVVDLGGPVMVVVDLTIKSPVTKLFKYFGRLMISFWMQVRVNPLESTRWVPHGIACTHINAGAAKSSWD